MRERVPRLKVPERVHPLVRRLFELMREEQIGVLDMAARSGMNKNTLRDWRTRTVPIVTNLDACLNVVGYELCIRRKKDA